MSAAEASRADLRTPRFSLVVPVYGVADYLPEFLAGLDDQHLGPEVELIFVDDGSPDESATMIERWIGDRPGIDAQLVRQPNGGLSAARNTGLEAARGDWVSFPDPDDRVEPGYLAAIATFLEQTESSAGLGIDLLCGNALIWDDTTGSVSDTHPLHRRFRRGDRVVDLQHRPETIHLQSATAFYRRERIEQQGLRFDPAIRPSFEDAAFTLRYLAFGQRRVADAPPQVGLVASAHYRYRRRGSGSSLVQRSWSQPAKYADVLEHGYLPVLRDLQAELGLVPLWAQNTVLYDLLFTFRREDRAPGLRDLVDPDWTPRFHELVEQVLQLIDPETVEGFAVMRTSRQLRTALTAGYQDRHRRPAQVSLVRYDAEQRLVELRYFFSGEPPAEVWHVAGRPASPSYAKTRDLSYLGRVLLRERICWLPATGDLRVWLDGRATALHYGTPGDPDFVATPAGWRRALGSATTKPKSTKAVAAPPPRASVWQRAARNALRRAATLIRSRRPRRTARSLPAAAPADTVSGPDFGRSWVFASTAADGRDDVDQLWHWIRRHRPEINAWRLVEHPPTTDREIEVGTSAHARLLSGALHLISDAPDRSRWLPPRHRANEPVPWRFTVLPGAAVDTAAGRWLTRTPLDRMVVSSAAEQEALSGPGSPSPLTAREVRLTGHPRHDRLPRGPEQPEHVVVLVDAPAGSIDRAALEQRLGSALHLLGPGEDPYAWLPRAAVLVTVRPWLALDAAFLDRPAIGWGPGLSDHWSDVLGPQVTGSEHLLQLIEQPPPVADLRFGFADRDNCRRTYESLLELTRVDPRARRTS